MLERSCMIFLYQPNFYLSISFYIKQISKLLVRKYNDSVRVIAPIRVTNSQET